LEGKDPAQDGVVSEIDHHLVLILAEMFNWIALTRVAIKSQNHELLGKFIFRYMTPEKGELDALMAMTLNLQRCGILALSTSFCTSLLRYWMHTNPSVFL